MYCVPKNKMIRINLGFEEIELRKIVKEAGGRWNKIKKEWEMPYGEIIRLGLTKRILWKNETGKLPI